MLLAEGLKKPVRGWWDHRNNRMCKYASDFVLHGKSHPANATYDAVCMKSVGPHSLVCWQAAGKLQQNPECVVSWWGRSRPPVSCLLLKLISEAPVSLFVSNNTITQLEIHSCHLQIMQLCAKRCSVFTLSPEALVLEYSRIPPWNPPTTPALPSSVCRMLWDVKVPPPWEGLPEPTVCKPEQLFPEPCPFSYRTRLKREQDLQNPHGRSAAHS